VTAPLVLLRTTVPREWIDINEHMNATHYGLVIYDAHVRLTEVLGIGEDYVRATQCSKVVVESHMVYEREVALGDEIEVRSWLLAVDAKRLHFFHELWNVTRGARAATSEQVDVHVDLKLRQSARFPEPLYQALQERVREMLAVPAPRGVGSRIRPPANPWLGAT